MIPYKQLSLADFFSDCQNKFDNDKYEFLSILEETINLDEIVPVSFISHFHAATGRPRKHLLYTCRLYFFIFSCKLLFTLNSNNVIFNIERFLCCLHETWV